MNKVLYSIIIGFIFGSTLTTLFISTQPVNTTYSSVSGQVINISFFTDPNVLIKYVNIVVHEGATAAYVKSHFNSYCGWTTPIPINTHEQGWTVNNTNSWMCGGTVITLLNTNTLFTCYLTPDDLLIKVGGNITIRRSTTHYFFGNTSTNLWACQITLNEKQDLIASGDIIACIDSPNYMPCLTTTTMTNITIYHTWTYSNGTTTKAITK